MGVTMRKVILPVIAAVQDRQLSGALIGGGTDVRSSAASQAARSAVPWLAARSALSPAP